MEPEDFCIIFGVTAVCCVFIGYIIAECNFRDRYGARQLPHESSTLPTSDGSSDSVTKASGNVHKASSTSPYTSPVHRRHSVQPNTPSLEESPLRFELEDKAVQTPAADRQSSSQLTPLPVPSVGAFIETPRSMRKGRRVSSSEKQPFADLYIPIIEKELRETKEKLAELQSDFNGKVKREINGKLKRDAESIKREANLAEALDRVEAENMKLQEELSLQTRNTATLRRKITSMYQENAAELERLSNERIKAAEDALHTKETYLAELQVVQERVNTVQDEKSTILDEKKALVQEMDILSQNLKNVQGKLQNSQEETLKLKDEHKELVEFHGALEATSGVVNQQLTELKSSFQQLEAEVQHYQEELDNTNSSLEAAEARGKEQTKGKEALQKSLESLRQEVEQAKNYREEFESTKSSLKAAEAHYKEKTTENDVLQKSLESLRQEVEQAEKAHADRINSISDEAKKLQNENEALKCDKSSIQTEYEKMQEQYVDIKNENAALRQTATTLEQSNSNSASTPSQNAEELEQTESDEKDTTQTTATESVITEFEKAPEEEDRKNADSVTQAPEELLGTAMNEQSLSVGSECNIGSTAEINGPLGSFVEKVPNVKPADEQADYESKLGKDWPGAPDGDNQATSETPRPETEVISPLSEGSYFGRDSGWENIAAKSTDNEKSMVEKDADQCREEPPSTEIPHEELTGSEKPVESDAEDEIGIPQADEAEETNKVDRNDQLDDIPFDSQQKADEVNLVCKGGDIESAMKPNASPKSAGAENSTPDDAPITDEGEIILNNDVKTLLEDDKVKAAVEHPDAGDETAIDSVEDTKRDEIQQNDQEKGLGQERPSSSSSID